LAGWRLAKEGVQPDSQCDQADDECESLPRLDQIEHGAGKGENRKCPYAAGN
jgi:hypothetical protein